MSRLETFAANVLRSGLVAPTALDRARSSLANGADANAPLRLARLLIQSGAITPYQARKLLAGATRGFFLGGYRILRRLGEGGMGKVYLAQPEGGGEPVAVKVLPPSKAAAEAQTLHRFRREMELSQRVLHPNLARTLDVGREGDIYYMVLEYVPGRSLYQMVRDEGGGPFRVPDAARLFLQIVAGLGAAHESGLIHRDVKPSNLMVTPESNAKILDLGLARPPRRGRPALTLQHRDRHPRLRQLLEQLGDAAGRPAERSSTRSAAPCTSRWPGGLPSRAATSSTRYSSRRWTTPSPWSGSRGASHRRSRRSSAS